MKFQDFAWTAAALAIISGLVVTAANSQPAEQSAPASSFWGAAGVPTPTPGYWGAAGVPVHQ